MDNNEAKLLLGAYRANGADAQDPFFREALKQAETDPSLRAWLAEEQAFDAGIARALAGIAAPAAGKAMIRTTVKATRPARRRWLLPLALAAGIALLVGVPDWNRSGGVLRLPHEATLAELATHLSEHHSSMGLMSPDYAKLRQWIAARGGPLPENLPPGLAKMGVIGCQTWTTSRGKVALVCFVGDNQQVGHLYVFDRLPDDLKSGAPPTVERPRLGASGAWSLAVWQHDGRGYVLGFPAGTGPAPDLAGMFRA